MTEPLGKVEFTPRQLAWLEQAFPEVTATANATNDEIRWALARRSVIHEIRTRLQKERR